MKTYLFDTFNRYKRFSEELDAQTILCNKSWWVFNDSGEKEVYIFNTDGTMIIAVSGKVTNATWQYITANKSIVITGNNQSYMVKPAFFDKQIFALQVDGTNDYAFLIDENNRPSTNLRSLADLKEHFAEKERQALLEEQRKLQAELSKIVQKEIDADRKRQKSTDEDAEAEELRLKGLYNNLYSKADRLRVWFHRIAGIWFAIAVLVKEYWDINLYPDFINHYFYKVFITNGQGIFQYGEGWYMLYALIMSIIFVILFIKITWELSFLFIYERLLSKYKKENPTDLNAIKYLKEQERKFN